MDNSLFRVLTEPEAEEFRQWARDNYTPGDDVPEIWHPVLREECERMNVAELTEGGVN